LRSITVVGELVGWQRRSVMLQPACVTSSQKRLGPGSTLVGLEKWFLPKVLVAVCSVSVVTSYPCDDQGLDGRYVAVGRADMQRHFTCWPSRLVEWWRLDHGQRCSSDKVALWHCSGRGCRDSICSTVLDAVVFGANSYAMLSFSSKETGQRRSGAARHVVLWGFPLGLCVELCCC